MDFRSLAAYRIAVGLLVLGWSLLLLHDFALFYLAGGKAPISNNYEFLLKAILVGVMPLFAFSLILGAFARFSTFVCFIFGIVIQNAVPQILQGGDVLLSLLLFWSLFLPFDKRWALGVRGTKVGKLWFPRTASLAGWAVTLQICFVYWFAALLKSDPLWTQNGNALFYVLSLEHFTTPLGLYSRQYAHLLRSIALSTPWFELFGPILLFIPFHNEACRFAAVILFIGFHLIGMQLLLSIGLFPWVCATAWLIFIPGFFWDWLGIGTDRLARIDPQTSLRTPERSLPQPLRTAVDCALSCFVVAAFCDVSAWNIASLDGDKAEQFMQQRDSFGHIFHLDQRWDMYAPYPRKEHGWLIIPADLTNGAQIDLFTGHAVSWEKPDNIANYMGNFRWRRYLSNLFDNQEPQDLKRYAEYLVQKWNSNHGENQKVQAVSIIFMKLETQPDLTISGPEKDALYFKTY